MIMDKMFYLDNAATTPLTDNVKNRIIEVLDDFGNPSSVSELGRKTKNIIEDTRSTVRKFINAPANSNIIFTSSGSSANSLAIKGLVGNFDDNNYVILYSPTAHKSMLKCCKDCNYSHVLKVDKYGHIDLDYLEEKLISYRYIDIILCIEAANSEIGTIQKLDKIVNLAHKYHCIVVVDFTGYIPYRKVDVLNMDIDIATFSGHKLHALKGVGVLYKLEDINLHPLVYGSQEGGLFAGTENVVGITSLGEALSTYVYDYKSTHQRDYLWNLIKEGIKDCYLVGADKIGERLPCNLFICFKGIDGSNLASLLELEGIYVSTGSACNNYVPDPSSTLVAIGMDENDYHSCIRISFEGTETDEDLNYIYKKIYDCVNFLKG